MPCRNFEDVVDRQERILGRWVAGAKAGAVVLCVALAVAYWRHR